MKQNPHFNNLLKTLLKVLSIIQSTIRYQKHCRIFQALFQYPNYHPKTGALSIIQLSSSQGIIPDPKQHPLSTTLSPIQNTA